MKCQRERCRNIAHANTPFCEKHAPAWRREQGTSYVPIEPVCAHVQRLRDSGLGWYQIARLSGVSAWVIRNVMADDQRHVTLKTARGLLALSVPEREHELASAGAVVSGLGTRRRLRALVAIGYTNEQIAEAIGYPTSQCGRLLSGEFDVTAGVARRVEEAFNRLHMKLPPEGYAANRARLRAARRGWFVPLAWNENTIDDPAAHPRGVSQSRDGWLVEYEKLRARGYPDRKIAAMLGIEETSLSTRLRRAKAA